MRCIVSHGASASFDFCNLLPSFNNRFGATRITTGSITIYTVDLNTGDYLIGITRTSDNTTTISQYKDNNHDNTLSLMLLTN